ncbi:DUF1697 domain-containing protein [Neobacillus sp. PS3-40]|uniref:DUF1697 domain-containing protein n=1 Tax=Neobacillus sp. PS3-40 TaxID=3070679 RepID=UPI0027DF8CDD|nr:DUF1697 domain-containing protein [Neobacillus sp. PS3-40]WML44197.1 DUF1697 domain-containing protein [Neobacillus sp. PS3-40]
MTTYIALLRGINVGGHNKIKMAELKQLFETLGVKNVQTYIQSGNVLFESEEEADTLCHRIETEIQKVFGFSITVVIRTALELEQIIKNCPYPTDNLAEGQSLHLAFLAKLPSQERIDHLLTFKSEMDECQLVGKQVYLFLRQSILTSKLAVQLQKLGVQVTVRNWKTTNKLATLSKSMK